MYTSAQCKFLAPCLILAAQILQLISKVYAHLHTQRKKITHLCVCVCVYVCMCVCVSWPEFRKGGWRKRVSESWCAAVTWALRLTPKLYTHA